ncbi:MerR family transcriptional regulator [Pseudomonas umsongensis]|jgi:DNA-binding transcriptional MerR regulator|uniref:Helix-turn-helix-type transcriptional regulator n=1 Tax=Pseudomonas umsongensis TaxID=198618 RepID=A0ABX4DV69_9PSED|nr:MULTISPECIES: MerR family transcriptional regulator [Pseudomonas]KEX90933.1 MerR family transcriptional regulator [Pseudomonas putida]EPA97988.1 putative transcriptional regulator [Pseudomonas sp. G5(2012)]OXR32595.1 helix-turn-helix-type transcriptional regulator [Pseudomonas umsongensis]QFG27972.1 MerR family transcriptional regulator [Pseudomonas umsongensis]SDS07561.1 DNA-binding transcriptional regulator, MerR family [Pseudomonas umsongensis]
MPVLTDVAPGVSPALSLEREELFPIREVARLTGVNPVTLRAWERRYGLIVPTRTESGHRLYSMQDIERVRSILNWIERGVAVSKIGKILAKAEPLQVLAHIIPSDLVQADYAQWQQQLAAAVSAFDDIRLEQVYGQIFSSYSQPVVFQDIILPLWRQLLQRQDTFGRASEWLFLDGFLRSRVVQRLLLIRDRHPRRVIVSALAGQCRELELLIAALFLGNDQMGVRVLTTGQPFDELTLVCERIKPRALVLVSNHVPTPDLPRRLNRLAMSLDCPLLLAGDASDLAQESLAGSSIGCLGNEGTVMRQRLSQFLAGSLDT